MTPTQQPINALLGQAKQTLDTAYDYAASATEATGEIEIDILISLLRRLHAENAQALVFLSNTKLLNAQLNTADDSV